LLTTWVTNVLFMHISRHQAMGKRRLDQPLDTLATRSHLAPQPLATDAYPEESQTPHQHEPPASPKSKRAQLQQPLPQMTHKWHSNPLTKRIKGQKTPSHLYFKQQCRPLKRQNRSILLPQHPRPLHNIQERVIMTPRFQPQQTYLSPTQWNAPRPLNW
jgi:hypothetical protein